jgi:hypothetical protein
MPFPPRPLATGRGSVFVRFAYPVRVIVTTTVLLGDEVLHGHVAVVGDSRVRGSSPYFSAISASSSRTISRCRVSLARIALYFRDLASSRANSSCRPLPLQAASRRSCMSRIAVACSSSMSSSSIRPPRAASADSLARISAMTRRAGRSP